MKRKDFIASFLAFSIQFGLFYFHILFYYLKIPWNANLTIIFYSALTIIILCQLCSSKSYFRSANSLDIFFFFFITIICASLCLENLSISLKIRVCAYLCFMVFAPYMCGSLISYSKIKKFQNLVLFFSLVILPLLVFDHLVTPDTGRGRSIFFDLEYSPLMIGSLLSWALIIQHLKLLFFLNSNKNKNYLIIFIYLMFLITLVVFLVWVSARGWLIAGISGTILITVTKKQEKKWQKFVVILIILFAAGVSLRWLDLLDNRFGKVYSIARESVFLQSHQIDTSITNSSSNLILNKVNCLSIVNDNSISIRLNLYREAMEIFLQRPLLGVGVSSFGLYSCLGPEVYPHSTILQILSELGLLGICVYSILIILTFTKLLSIKRKIMIGYESSSIDFLISLFLISLIADQIYGNYLISITSWLIIGITAGLKKID